MEPIKFKLSVPITTHKGVIDEIELKRPAGRSFTKHGVPYKTVREGGEDDTARVEFQILPKAMLAFMSDMSGIEAMLLEDLDAYDFMQLANTIVGIIGSRPTNGSK